MDIKKWLLALPQFLVLLPAAVSCYFTVKNQMKYSVRMTAALCAAVLVPYSFACAWFCMAFQIDVNIIFMPSLVLFFLLYRCTITTDLPRSLAVYVGVCAIETFPAQFAYAFDAYLHPASGAAHFSAGAAFFQFGLSCVLMAAFALPASRQFAWVVDNLDYPKIWYAAVKLSSIFLTVNVVIVPQSYSTFYAGRVFWLFLLVQGCALVILVGVYLLFFQGAAIIMEHTELREQAQLLAVQSHQYCVLQEHLQQTERLRHDFRHSVRLLSSLAEDGDICSIRKHLAEYDLQMERNAATVYCSNAALNALFNYYHEMAVSAGIEIEWKIGLPDPLTVSELDMASLFGNLIENAISGCRGVPEKSRYFYLTSKLHYGYMLYVVATNSFDGQVRMGQGEYLSTKHHGKGTGLASVIAIAKKYQGVAHISNSDKEFFVDVALKIGKDGP